MKVNCEQNTAPAGYCSHMMYFRQTFADIHTHTRLVHLVDVNSQSSTVGEAVSTSGTHIFIPGLTACCQQAHLLHLGHPRLRDTQTHARANYIVFKLAIDKFLALPYHYEVNLDCTV